MIASGRSFLAMSLISLCLGIVLVISFSSSVSATAYGSASVNADTGNNGSNGNENGNGNNEDMNANVSVNASDNGKDNSNNMSYNNDTNMSDNNGNNNSNGIGQQLSVAIHAKQEELKEGNYTGSFGQELDVKQLSENLRELRSNNVSADTDLNITAEDSDQGTIFKAHLSNSQESEIKIMPDTASAVALSKLGLNVCSSDNNCTIQLKEVGSNNSTQVAYDVNAEKNVKVLGLFNAQMNVEADVDAQTGEVISSKMPWWAFLASSR